VLEGEILDVAVDLRKNRLMDNILVCFMPRIKQLMVPHGFAHGFPFQFL
jgi:dTDP-4-dehydrorhamnose 3,5-epimerase-like enzyme